MPVGTTDLWRLAHRVTVVVADHPPPLVLIIQVGSKEILLERYSPKSQTNTPRVTSGG